ncbi:MAG: DUF4369 domain-containing protein, partial [Bacteroidaceae bacterium]|nr:DUF4369 domain-containing protein [Bacteroidaceae bacterium]
CLCASCADQYMVKGTSSVQLIEGNMLYLKVYQGDKMQTIDSTRVVHGRFTFRGAMDSTVLANLYMDDVSLMPLVLEDGEVTLRIDELQRTAEGTPLNDSLSAFVRRKSRLEASLAELSHRESQMIMDGLDHDEVVAELSAEASQLHEENDRLVTSFIKQNYNNVLGPGVFMILTSNIRYPVLNPVIESIIAEATPYFLQHPYVQQYLKVAEENMEKLRE